MNEAASFFLGGGRRRTQRFFRTLHCACGICGQNDLPGRSETPASWRMMSRSGSAAPPPPSSSASNGPSVPASSTACRCACERASVQSAPAALIAAPRSVAAESSATSGATAPAVTTGVRSGACSTRAHTARAAAAVASGLAWGVAMTPTSSVTPPAWLRVRVRVRVRHRGELHGVLGIGGEGGERGDLLRLAPTRRRHRLPCRLHEHRGPLAGERPLDLLLDGRVAHGEPVERLLRRAAPALLHQPNELHHRPRAQDGGLELGGARQAAEQSGRRLGRVRRRAGCEHHDHRGHGAGQQLALLGLAPRKALRLLGRRRLLLGAAVPQPSDELLGLRRLPAGPRRLDRLLPPWLRG
eukprot:scaffold69711_cov74-Phaeocystis_antarctica.AAC.2